MNSYVARTRPVLMRVDIGMALVVRMLAMSTKAWDLHDCDA
jgi:hypothetical protein